MFAMSVSVLSLALAGTIELPGTQAEAMKTASEVLERMNLPAIQPSAGSLTSGLLDTEYPVLAPYVEDANATDHGWTRGRFEVEFTFSGSAPVSVTVTARFERFGVPSAMLLIPPAWVPVASNGRLESAIMTALVRHLSLPLLSSPRTPTPEPRPLPDDNPPFIPNVKASNDPGTGNQNETTLGVFRGGFLFGGWNDNRSGVYHVGFARSTDYGSTWLPDTQMIDPTYPEDGDPVICVDDSGTVYYFWLSFNRNTSSGDIILTKSTNRGASWGPMQNVTPGTPSSLDDKPWVTIDGNNVFLTWYDAYASNNLLFKRSTNRGTTWGSAIAVGSGGNGTFPFRGTDSTIFVGWGMQSISLNKSTNMGASWQGQRTIISCTWSPGSPPWRMNNIPSFGTSLDRTKSYVVFADSRLQSNQTDVFFSRSTDAGATWMTPVKLNDNPTDGTHQFFPWLAVDPFDRLHCTWHDSRAGSNRVAQYYAYSTDQGLTWSANYRVSDSAYTAGTFLGDYTACQADSERVYALWCDCRNGSTNPDAYFSRAAHIPSLPRDVGVTAILVPADTVDSGYVVAPAAVVRNYGSTQETFPVQLRIDTIYSNTVSETLAAGATDTVLFANWTPNKLGTFQVRCTTGLAGDPNPGNNLKLDTVTVVPWTGLSEGRAVGLAPLLFAPEPNPARRKVTLRFALPRTGPARLLLYSSSGRLAATLVDGLQNAGLHTLEAGTALSPGIYLVRLSASGFQATRKLVLD